MSQRRAAPELTQPPRGAAAGLGRRQGALIRRRHFSALALALVDAQAGAASASTSAAAKAKVFRYAFRVAETGFDPARISDIYSRTITPHIFESLYAYDHLARPARILPLTASALPETADNFRSFTIQVKPGIFFADDPAFKGQRRELVAADYVYSLKRFADPAVKSPAWSDIETLTILGLREQRQQALKERTPFDYDRALPGLYAPDRYTLQLRLAEPRPRLVETLADSGLYGAVAREVVQAYGEQTAAHPVGTGPFRLKSWRRSSEIVLERSPSYREVHYEDEAHPEPGDAEGQALLARFKGRRLPLVDQVAVAIIEENQPRWLSFLNKQFDFIERMPEEFVNVAMPGGKLAPNLAAQGMVGYRTLGPEIVLTMYNMEDPLVGGYSPEKVALRRAINLGIDIAREIAIPRRGQGEPAHSPIVPHTTGYSAAFKSEMGEYSPAKARALLDLYGYVDRNGDGWREQPDGSPLVLLRATQPDSTSRQLDEVMQKNMTAIGLKMEFRPAKWPENLKAAQAGKLMMWGVASGASQLDGQGALLRLYGPSAGGGNLARFKYAEFDALYDRMLVLPDGPERDALFVQAKRMAVAWAPYKNHLHRYYTDIAQGWLIGYRRPLFWNRWWHLIDIDEQRQPAPH